MTVFDDRLCTLGEGPLWHPERQQLFWFDIQGKALLSRVGEAQLRWDFEEHVSAAGWIDHDRLLVASETALFRFDLETGERADLCALEQDKPANRSNDGRADPYGGFWIGTMGKDGEPLAGSIYRFYRGEIELLYPEMTITNSICFAPGGDRAYFIDTRSFLLKTVALNDEGWPVGEPEIFLDLRAMELKADGAVVDVAGNVWIAHWGQARVSAYSPDGALLHSEGFPATQVTCPAFGGADFSTLHVTSARVNFKPERLKMEPLSGATFARTVPFQGQREHQVIL